MGGFDLSIRRGDKAGECPAGREMRFPVACPGLLWCGPQQLLAIIPICGSQFFIVCLACPGDSWVPGMWGGEVECYPPSTATTVLGRATVAAWQTASHRAVDCCHPLMERGIKECLGLFPEYPATDTSLLVEFCPNCMGLKKW